ncbi:YdeI/OmpD-associated family protein [Candidatus Uhrbacteria bacterium]|nr:YdeI/OmpD-associated family protein [Candidatus Uhrbacteria bacterium]
MAKQTMPSGTAHMMPPDLQKALESDRVALAAWEDLTPLARNEWICWVTFVKKSQTRKEHVKRAVDELKKGKRRPCCWLGCTHRTDKKVSPSVRAILDRRSKKLRGKKV